jgi:hypothetical protein
LKISRKLRPKRTPPEFVVRLHRGASDRSEIVQAAKCQAVPSIRCATTGTTREHRCRRSGFDAALNIFSSLGPSRPLHESCGARRRRAPAPDCGGVGAFPFSLPGGRHSPSYLIVHGIAGFSHGAYGFADSDVVASVSDGATEPKLATVTSGRGEDRRNVIGGSLSDRRPHKESGTWNVPRAVPRGRYGRDGNNRSRRRPPEVVSINEHTQKRRAVSRPGHRGHRAVFPLPPRGMSGVAFGVAGPVRGKRVRALSSDGIEGFVECGPLRGLARHVQEITATRQARWRPAGGRPPTSKVAAPGGVAPRADHG